MHKSTLPDSFKPLLALSTCAITLAAFLPSHAAAAESILSARTELSGLHFTLVDLAPNDGVDPWIHFITPQASQYPSTVIDAIGAGYTLNESQISEPLEPSRSFYTFSAETPVTSTQWLPTQSATVTSLDGLASATATTSSLVSTVHMSEADILAHRYQTIPELGLAPDTWRTDSVSYTEAGQTPPNMVQPVKDPATGDVFYKLRDPMPSRNALSPHFELSANAAVIFEGTVTLQGHFDLSHYTLDELEDTLVIVGSTASLDIGPDTAITEQTQWSTHADAMAALNIQSRLWSQQVQYKYFNNRGNPPALIRSYAATEDFSVTFSNDSAETLTGRVHARSYDLITVMGVQAIPEPSTWALMALGLAGIAGLTAHQRRAVSAS